MELLFAGLAGLIIGALSIFATPHRSLIGVALPAALGGVVALVLWEGLTWLGSAPGFGWLAYDRGWIWWITILVTILACVLTVRALGAGRSERDADLLDRLSHVGRTERRARRVRAATTEDDAPRAAAEDDAPRAAAEDDAQPAGEADADAIDRADSDEDAAAAGPNAQQRSPTRRA